MTFAPTLQELKRSLGGEVTAGQLLCPGPGHSAKDRSLSVRLSPGSPDGFLARSFAGDDWRACRDHIRARLGLPTDGWKDSGAKERPAAQPPEPDDRRRVEMARKLWGEAVEPRGTIAEAYHQSGARSARGSRGRGHSVSPVMPLARQAGRRPVARPDNDLRHARDRRRPDHGNTSHALVVFGRQAGPENVRPSGRRGD